MTGAMLETFLGDTAMPKRMDLAATMTGTMLEMFLAYWWVVVAVLVLWILSLFVPRRRSRQRGKSRPRFSGRQGTRRWSEEGRRSDASRLGDPRAQMEFISRVDFEPEPLLNKSEYRILQLLEKVVREIGVGYRVMAQTSMGEIIAPRTSSASKEERDLAYRSINSKRLDFLVINRFGLPCLAVEYQGHGHYQGKAFMRDAVKREAIRKAGIGFLEIPADYDAEEQERQIHSMLQQSRARQRSS